MSEASPQNSSSLPSLEVRIWLGQLLWTVGVAAVLTFGYAFYSESALFRGLGIQLLLTVLLIWSTRRSLEIQATMPAGQPEFLEVWSLHTVFTAGPLMVLLIGVIMSLLVGRVEVARPLSPQEIATSSILAVLAASLWTALGKMTHGVVEKPSRELSTIQLSLHAARVGWFLAAAAQLASSVFAAIPQWLAVIVQLYLVIVIGESLLRLLIAWFQLERVTITSTEELPQPLDSLVREVLLSSLNPLDTLFQIAERRFGLSLRSSWSIRFFRRATPVALLLSLLVFWLSTSLVIVQPDQLALSEVLGQVQAKPLEPGLHWKYPWPFGNVRRVSVGEIRTLQIGFSQPVEEKGVVADQPRSMLWTEPHANEFALVLGTQSELVAVNAQIYFQVGRSVEQLKNYLLRHSDPGKTLEAVAYQVLREETENATLDQVLTEDRQAFAQRIASKVTEKSRQMQLGIEIVDVSLLSLHPPVEAAGAYLDVSNAESDAQRRVIQARGDAQAKLLTAEKESAGLVAFAKQAAAQRVGLAGQEASHFAEASKAYRAAPETYRTRLWFDTYEKALPGRQVYVIDSQLQDVLVTDSNTQLSPTVIPPRKSTSP
ncbi:protease modulator HflK [Bremerella cremea]|uniref:Protease modulator HflK n=1 Tax=Bremerella cremea TaxID=1031537 RepID=A0A368KVL9_9BACT|nr:protease modulator HflK [Bremerella cremea]RCS54458.1 protease modulator HflK [Bremerella cremea]